MAEPKTKPNAASVAEFLGKITDEETRQDCERLVRLLRAATKAEPVMWGPSIVGFGTYHYVYASGREGDWMLAGFSPRKQSLSLYFTCDIQQYQELLDQLGPHSCGKGCLYVKRLSDIHLPTLKKLLATAIRHSLQTRDAAEKVKAAAKPAAKQKSAGKSQSAGRKATRRNDR